ncbi:MAG: lysine--tRNA ligase [Sphingomonadales bacterium]|nr:lysine--tRNA ligase [Sphingomonadales bacterium]
MTERSEQERIRRDALEAIRSHGVDPYPSINLPISHTIEEILTKYQDEDADLWKEVVLGGRMMSRRIMGKASFAELQDGTGRMQLYLNRDELDANDDPFTYNELFRKYCDIGDHIGVKGCIFRTQVGEISLRVQEFTLLSKSLRPLPIVKRNEQGQEYDGFHDPEQRHRMRYVDLVVNPEVREVFRKRARMIQLMRDYFNERGFLEVETPILQPIYGGAAARPFTTHHNTLDMKLYLRIANELYLKRLIVGGFDGVYEFARDFRNEGMSRYHNPEFTQVELYAAYRDYRWMMDMTEELIEQVAIGLHDTTEVQVGDQKINFARPWKRYTWHGAIEAFTGLDLRSLSDQELLTEARKLGAEVPAMATRPALLDEIFGHCVEPHLIQPTFITDYPVEMSPLAKRHADHPELTERFELICNRKELANSFSELNDPDDQRARFEAQIELGKRGDAVAMMPDEDFLRALEYGMPPTAGIGVGIDRLSMIMTNQSSIQEVLLFPHMRPEHGRPE